MFGFFARRQQPALELKLSIDFLIEPDGDSFHAFSPALPGLHACGDSADEASQNFSDCIPAYLESLAKHGDPLPVCKIEVLREEHPPISAGAFLRHVQVPWPSLQTSGIS
jgi:predicted RNase H-like HicB family nuclease